MNSQPFNNVTKFPPLPKGEGRGEGEGSATIPTSSSVPLEAFRLASEAKAQTLRAPMAWKRRIAGGVLGVIGFMLSPLSWWNDAVVNLPLAWLFASLVALVYKPAAEPNSKQFDALIILGYWLTNVLGFILMHKGAQQALSKEEKKYTRRELVKDLSISLLYTALIVVLLKVGILKPISAYFSSNGN